MKFLIEIKDKYSSITLLTEDHEKAMDMYNTYKNSSEVNFYYMSEKKEAEFIDKINKEAYLASPFFE